MLIQPAQPIGTDVKQCEDCNGFGVKVELALEIWIAERLPTGRLEVCETCGGQGLVPDGEPLVDPSMYPERGHD